MLSTILFVIGLSTSAPTFDNVTAFSFENEAFTIVGDPAMVDARESNVHPMIAMMHPGNMLPSCASEGSYIMFAPSDTISLRDIDLTLSRVQYKKVSRAFSDGADSVSVCADGSRVVIR